MLSGVQGRILEFLGVEVRRVCDGSQEMSSRVVGGHSTAALERSRALTRPGTDNKVSLGFPPETVSPLQRYGVPMKDSYMGQSVISHELIENVKHVTFNTDV
jgi:hypothetical protein